MWREHIWNVSVLQKVHIYNLVLCVIGFIVHLFQIQISYFKTNLATVIGLQRVRNMDSVKYSPYRKTFQTEISYKNEFCHMGLLVFRTISRV
jgi:hypothetical protein